jgi:hypothetical protein
MRILDPNPAFKKMCTHADPNPQPYKGAISGTIIKNIKNYKFTFLHAFSA